MKQIKNILVGFLVSFIGSIPLGYLNVVGFEIYKSKGLEQTLWYLLGVVFIEFFVILITLIFANTLISNKKLLKYIEGFSIVFMFFLAYLFFSNAQNSDLTVVDNLEIINSKTIIIGITLSSLNFIQIPFWLSWNLFLVNAKYIDTSSGLRYFYILGTTIGTFLGMLFLILSLQYITQQTDFLNKYLVKIIIPLVFFIFGIIQSIKFYRKYIK